MTAPKTALDHTAIVVTTFLRDELLFRCIESIRKLYPKIQIFVGDNGNESTDKTAFLKRHHCRYYHLPFDIGVAGVRNETLTLIPKTYRYLLIAEDDFVFTEKSRIENLRAVLDAEPDVGLCGCLLYLKDNKEQHYEARVHTEGDTVYIKRVWDSPEPKVASDGTKYWFYDLVLNAFLMRRQVWDDNPWDPQFKTAFEHFDFFLSLQTKTKWKVAYTRDASINHLPDSPGDYKKFRARPMGWKLFGEKWGLKFVNSDYSHEQPMSYEAMGEGKSVDLKGDNLRLAADVLNANQCTWWIDAGTCLGAIRERGFIPHDPDIDIGLHPKELHLWDKLQADMLAAGFELYKAWMHGKQKIELSYKRNGVKVDLFFYRDDGDFWWHGTFGPNKEGGWGHDWEFLPHVFSAHLFKELQPITLNNIPCFVPNPPKRYLLERYGKGWPMRQKTYRYWTDCRAIDRNYFKKGQKVVFVGGVWDLFHEGHLAIIERAKALGTRLIVGVLTDKAALDYREQPTISYESRRRIVESIKHVDKVIAQNAKDPTPDLEVAGIRPHYLVHGDNWDQCPGEPYVRKHGGKVVFLPHTPGIEIRKWISEGRKSAVPNAPAKSSAPAREPNIAICIKTFMRDETLYKTISTYRDTFDKTQFPYRLYIADDGYQDDRKNATYTKLRAEGNVIITLPFDSGISVGRNAMLKQVKEDYILITDDDVVIRDPRAVRRMKTVLDSDENIGLVAATLKYEKGAYFAGEGYAKGIKFDVRGNLLARVPAPRAVHDADGVRFIIADQVPNIFLAKKDIFQDVSWDNRIKVEYEHMDFFLALKKTKWQAAVCLDAEAFHLISEPDSEYLRFRHTAPQAYFLGKHGFGAVSNQF